MSDLNDELPQIPAIMKKLKAPVAGALSQRWFDGPPSDDRSKQPPDTTDVTMQWALGFARAKKVYDQLIHDRIWSNFNAQMEISHMIQRKRLMATGPVPFGNLDASVLQIDKDYITELPVAVGFASKATDPFDDMYLALGGFNLRVAIQGSVAPVKPSGYEITINRIGVYVQDKYDFQGDQLLGFWKFGDAGNVSRVPWFGYQEISNGSFRNYRAAKHHGGDFWVFSDVKIVNLHPPDKFMAKV